MPAWLLDWLVSIALSVLKGYGVPALITALQGMESKYPGLKPLLDEVIAFLLQLKSNPNAQPSPALVAAAAAHKRACEGVGCPADLKA